MFYAYDLFVKKGPLGKMWLAGTMKKITRAVATSTNIVQLCNVLEHPPAPLALPAQATLLRGVVRIEHQKVSFLLTDAVHAKSRVMLADKKLKKVNLPLKNVIARKEAITVLPTELADEEPIPDLPNADVLSQILAAGDAFHVEPTEALSPRKVLPAKEQDLDITRSRVSTAPSAGDELELELPPMEPPVIPEPEEEPKPRTPRKRKPRALGEAAEPDLGAEPMELDEADKKREAKKAEKEKKRKRRIVPVDEVTEISDEQMKANLRDTSDIVVKDKWKSWKPATKPREKNKFCSTFPLWHLMPEQLRQFYRERAVAGPIDPDEALEDVEEDRDTIPFPNLEEISIGTDRLSMEREARPSMEGSFFEPPPIELEPEDVGIRPSPQDKRKAGPRKSVSIMSPFPATPTPSQPLATHGPARGPIETEISKMTEVYRELLNSAFARHPDKAALDFAESLQEATTLNHQAVGEAKKLELNASGEATEMKLKALEEETQRSLTNPPGRYDAGVSFHQLLILRQLDIVKVTQTACYAPLTISQGRNWKERFSSSQMDSSAPLEPDTHVAATS